MKEARQNVVNSLTVLAQKELTAILKRKVTAYAEAPAEHTGELFAMCIVYGEEPGEIIELSGHDISELAVSYTQLSKMLKTICGYE